jgi:hypothetical protein
VEALRRASDNELCGYVQERDSRWHALTLFGADLGIHDDRDSAVRHVLDEGLPALAQRWTLRHGPSGDEEVVCIQEVDDDTVTVARGYYSMPGVPTLRITRSQLAAGEWELHL